eukprot:484829_1
MTRLVFVFIAIWIMFCACYGHAQYDIDTWNTVITNKAANDHQIPLTIHYPRNTEREHAVLLFHHGYHCPISEYNYIWQRLVPLGFIIVMPGDYTSRNSTDERKCAISLRFSLDFIKQCNMNQTSPLYQMVGQKAIAVGHSLGGGVVILCSSSNYSLGQSFDSSFDAVVSLSGRGNTDDFIHALKHITIPIFLWTASHDCCNSPNDSAIPYYHTISNNKTCKFMANIANGTHCGFMNASAEHAKSCAALSDELCASDRLRHHHITRETQMDIVIQYLIRFMDVTMKNQLLDNENQLDFAQMKQQLQQDTDDGVLTSYNYDCMESLQPNDDAKTQQFDYRILIIVCGAVVVVLCVGIGVYFKRRNKPKLQDTQLDMYMLHE